MTGHPVARISAAFCHPGTIGVLGARAAPDDPRPVGGVAAAGGDPGAGVRGASGQAAQKILSAVDAEDGDLLLVAWARDVSGERAAVVKALLAESRVPVVLVPRAGSLPPKAHLREQRRPVEHAVSPHA